MSKKIFALILEVLLFCCISGFSQVLSKPVSSGVKISAWNVQTFFDARSDGNEYSEFRKSSAGWGREKYLLRLDRLCKTIKSLNADVFVMEEIENAGILYDISNQLAGNSWHRKKVYAYACFVRDSGSSIGLAVLSRFPIEAAKVHSLQIQSEKENQPALRPLLELTILADGKKLQLLVNHWKSMTGGEEKTELWRNWQESLLGERIAAMPENAAVLACGDFNRNIRKFKISKEIESQSSVNAPNVLFRYLRPSPEKLICGAVPVYSPWFSENGSLLLSGSYYFKNEWNYIDHFFSCGKAKIVSFSTESSGDWADENGIPKPYRIYNGTGYSDHLPVSCYVQF